MARPKKQSLPPPPPPAHSSDSSDRQQWQRIFRTLVEMVRSQQSQIETLASDRKFLERYIQIQHDRWSSRATLLESHISHMKTAEKKCKKVQAAKMDLMVGVKQREVLCYKRQFEQAESDLEDFRAYVEALIAEIAELKDKLKNRESDKQRTGDGNDNPAEYPKAGEKSTIALEGELRKLKHSYKKLSSQREAEVSALLAEKDFVWNQFKKVENDYTALLKSKRIEVEQANEAVEKLQSNLENLQSSVSEKVDAIARLEAERSRLELDLTKHKHAAEKADKEIEKLQLDMEKLHSQAKEKDEAIAELRNNLAKLEKDATISGSRKSRFSRDLDSQKNWSTATNTPTVSQLRRSSRKRPWEASHSNGSQKRKRDDNTSSRSQSSGAFATLKRCSGTKRARANSEVDSPKLFSANFKVPKLKKPSPVIS